MNPRRICCLIAVVLPLDIKRWIYRRYLGWEISDTAQIGLSFIDADHVTLAANSRIGHLNLITKLKNFELGEGAHIRNHNHIFGAGNDARFTSQSLTIGAGTLIMSRHFFDVSGNISIGADSVIGGRDSHLWSHTVIYDEGVRHLQPKSVDIGTHVYLGARVSVVHCQIPDNATVAAGAVVSKMLDGGPARFVIAGNPAQVVKRDPRQH